MIYFFASQEMELQVTAEFGRESAQTSWCNIDCAICDVCDFKATITLSGFKTDTCSC